MELELNRVAVPEKLRARVEEIAKERFPGSSVSWVDHDTGFIVVRIPDQDFGESGEVEEVGSVTKKMPARPVIQAVLEAELQSFVDAERDE